MRELGYVNLDKLVETLLFSQKYNDDDDYGGGPTKI